MLAPDGAPAGSIASQVTSALAEAARSFAPTVAPSFRVLLGKGERAIEGGAAVGVDGGPLHLEGGAIERLAGALRRELTAVIARPVDPEPSPPRAAFERAAMTYGRAGGAGHAHSPARSLGDDRQEASTVQRHAVGMPTMPTWSDAAAVRAQIEHELARDPRRRGRSARSWEPAFEGVLVDIVDALFAEAAILCERRRRGRAPRSVLDELAAGAESLVERVLERWAAALDPALHGATRRVVAAVVAGILEGFATTALHTASLLRDGAVSFWRALRLLVAAPGSFGAHDASKILVAVGGGLAFEELAAAIVDLAPVLSPAGPLVGAAVSGASAGLVALLLVALLDRVDLFGDERRRRRHERARTFLDELVMEVPFVPERLLLRRP